MKSGLDALIEELEMGTWEPKRSLDQRRPVQGSVHPKSARPLGILTDALPEPNEGSRKPSETSLHFASLDAGRRFGQPHAKLFPFIGHKVRTPEGPGTLIQVFAERVTVHLASESDKCAYFHHSEVGPVVSE